MAKLLAVLLLALITLCTFHATPWASHGRGGHHKERGHGSGSVQMYQCPGQCTRRCSKTQYHKPCRFFCQKCCRKCLCVPPGFYGNKQVCPCYNNWKTKEGGPYKSFKGKEASSYCTLPPVNISSLVLLSVRIYFGLLFCFI